MEFLWWLSEIPQIKCFTPRQRQNKCTMFPVNDLCRRRQGGWYPVRLDHSSRNQTGAFPHSGLYDNEAWFYSDIWNLLCFWWFFSSHMGLSSSHYCSDTFLSLNMEEKNTWSAIFSEKRDRGRQAKKCLKSLEDLEGALCQLMPFLQGWSSSPHFLPPSYTGVSVKGMDGESVNGETVSRRVSKGEWNRAFLYEKEKLTHGEGAPFPYHSENSSGHSGA